MCIAYLVLLFHTNCYAASAISSSLVVKCPEEQDKLWRILWPFAVPGSTQYVRCPGEGDVSGSGLAHRSCLAGGVWGPVDVTVCESVAVREVRIEVFATLFCVLLYSDVYDCVPISNMLHMQAKNLLSDLTQTLTDGLPILDSHRKKVKGISLTLRDALNQTTDNSVLPKDLETATNFVEIVAK